jgi:hypothetical protein
VGVDVIGIVIQTHTDTYTSTKTHTQDKSELYVISILSTLVNTKLLLSYF